MKKITSLFSLILIGLYASAQVLPKIEASEYDILNGNVRTMVEEEYTIKTSGTSFYKHIDYSFNNANLLTKYVYKAESSLLGSMEKMYIYDDNNRLTEAVEYDDLFGDLQIIYSYDNKDRLSHIKEVSEDPLWGYTSNFYYTTDKKGKLLTEKKLMDDKVTSNSTYTWKKDLLVKEETFKADGGLSSSYTYEYDNEGRMTKKVEKLNTGDPKTNTYRYNTKGLLIEYTSGYGSTTKTDYLNFDNKGNWIRKKLTTYNSADVITSEYYVYREINYYDGYSSSAFSYVKKDDKKDLSGLELDKTTWTHKAGSKFSINIPGFKGKKDFDGLYISSESNHVLCYEETTNASFLLMDFRDRDSGYTDDAIYLGNEDVVYWLATEGSFWVFHNGKSLTGNKNFWLGDDLVVYVTDLDRSFLFKDYKTKKHDYLHKGTEITTSSQAYFKKKDETYWLYINGVLFDFKNKEYKSAYMQNDLIFYDKEANKTYVLKNYKLTGDNILGQVDLASTTSKAFVYKTNSSGNYYMLVEGEYAKSKKTSKYAPNGKDLVVTLEDTGEKYIFYNFKNAGTYKLISGKKL